MHAPSVRALERSRVRRLGVALPATLLLSATAPPAFAAEIRQGDSIVVGPNETIDDDLYAVGSSVTILGTVNGDVLTAGSNITIGGTVNGDLFAAGGRGWPAADTRAAHRWRRPCGGRQVELR